MDDETRHVESLVRKQHSVTSANVFLAAALVLGTLPSAFPSAGFYLFASTGMCIVLAGLHIATAFAHNTDGICRSLFENVGLAPPVGWYGENRLKSGPEAVTDGGQPNDEVP
jgi:hypothetical protein